MIQITVTPSRQVLLPLIRATSAQATLLILAVDSYGFLLKIEPPGSHTLVDFADTIEKHYDTESNPQNRAVVTALREIQQQTDEFLVVQPA